MSSQEGSRETDYAQARTELTGSQAFPGQLDFTCTPKARGVLRPAIPNPLWVMSVFWKRDCAFTALGLVFTFFGADLRGL